MMRLSSIVPPVIKRPLRNALFFARYGFFPPAPYTDMSGYEEILDFIRDRGLLAVEGNIVEIGAFLGGGTYKLCRFLNVHRSNKKIITVDIFAPSSDPTPSTSGTTMAALYGTRLHGEQQRAVFDRTVKGCTNLTVIVADSKQVTLPEGKLCLAYIDGNHSFDYVVNDFGKVWPNIASGGAVGFDDYAHDIPSVTEAIHTIIGMHAAEIREVIALPSHKLFLIKK